MSTKNRLNKEWEEENKTSQTAGTCPNCGSTIYQTTYTDSCRCGEQDTSY